MGEIRHIMIISALLLILAINGFADDISPQWKVNEGDKFFFNLQIGVSPRETDLNERTMTEAAIIYIEITSLEAITQSSSWVPTLDYSLCRSVMHLQNGSILPDDGLFVHISSGIWNSAHLGAMPVGDWATASDMALAKNEDLSHNDSYEIVEDSTSWGFVYSYPNLNMTSTERWSKTDGSLLSINLINGISERMFPNESLDLTLMRYDSGTTSFVIIIGSAGVAVIIAAVVLAKKRSA
jgi:hypothetical protein